MPNLQTEQPPVAECDISIVIPAYNEGNRLGRFLPPVLEWLNQQSWTWEILVVDDGSTDNTADVARSMDVQGRIRVLRQEPNQGKGAAIRRGMMESVGKIVVFSDADFSCPITELPKLCAAIESGASVAIGSRGLPGSHLEIRQPPLRELTGRVFNFAVRWLLLPGIFDTQCGFKAFRRDVARSVFPKQKLDGFAFDVEVLLLAKAGGFSIAEVPVRWLNDPASKVSMLRGLQGFTDLIRLRVRLWRSPIARP